MNSTKYFKSETKCYPDVSYGNLPKPQARVYFFNATLLVSATLQTLKRLLLPDLPDSH